MQIIFVTHAGRRTQSVHLHRWQLSLLIGLLLLMMFGGSLFAWAAGDSNITLLRRVVEIWDGTRNDALAGKIGELRARIESLEAAMDVQPRGDAEPGLRLQSFKADSTQAQQFGLQELALRAGRLENEMAHQLARREEVARSVFDQSLAQPVIGGISSGFGWRTHPVLGELAFHRGIDFLAPAGAAVHASAAGVVTFIGPADTYGKLVVISHGERMQSRYAHLEGIEVTTGMVVTAGQRIGRVGSSGRTTGPHLHFELVLDGRVVNPKPFLAGGRRAASGHAPTA
ncbi:MAG: M23 family metallopeptidase [Rhodocyclaceae bacterium]|nr:M23 family metallopeptidase [Rhodocyclaceae bacterium]